MNKRTFALLLCLCLVLTMLPVQPAAAATTLASYYSTNAVGTGVKTTITVDGDISDWNSSMLIAQGTANDDPRVYRPNSMYEIPIDMYALYAAYDNENLYLMWEMTNVQDVVAPNDTYPLSQGVLFQTMNVPFFIAIDTGDAATAIGNNGALTTGGTIWDSGITFQQSFNKLIAISTNGANGPFLYGGTSAGLNPKEEAARAEVGMTFDYGLGILSKNVYGIDKAYGEWNDRLVGDMCNEDAAWVDFNTLGHSSSTMDFHYEMSISLESLGVTSADVAANGLGVLVVSTMGKSGMDCLPYDLSMNDQADLDDAAGSQEFNSFEKSDEDFITTSFARVGGGPVDPTAPTEKPTQKPSEDPSEPSSEPTDPTDPSNPDDPIDPPLPPVPPEPSYPQGVVYLKASNDWKVDGARFAAYFWDGNGKEVWVDATDADGDGYYEVVLPEGCPNIIFCRMNGSATANNWNNTWNQTDDLTVPTDNKIAFIKDAGWGKTGYWETYLPADWECPHASHNQNGACTECGETVEHTYTSKVTAPTCTADGYTTYTCSVCGKNYTDNVVTTKGHNYVNGTCTVCGATIPTHEHSYTSSTKHGNCTEPTVITYTCSGCGDTYTKSIPTSGHTFINGTCVACGAADSNINPEIKKFDITLANLTLGNDLTMYFYVPVAPCAEWPGSYAVITKPYADGTETAKVTVSLEGLTIITNNGEKLYKVPFTGIAAKEMTDEVTIEIFNAEGKAISNPGKESVRSYLDRFMKANATDATKMRLAIDMLNYGAAAQTHFGYNTENLANAGLSAAQKAFGTATAPACVNGNVKGANAKGSNLTLESSILMNFYFNGLTEDMYAVVTFTDHTGASHNEKLGAHDGSRFTVNQVVVADARQLVTVTVYNADGSVYGTCTDSVESYVARARDAQANGLALYEAIIKFADSAYTYLHNR